MTADDVWKYVTGLSVVVAGYFFGRKKGVADTKKAISETRSIDIKDEILVRDYNKREYDELFSEMQKYKLELFEYKEKVKVLEQKIDELLRKFHVYQNLKTK